jgi:cell wall assembly regulator SMI1
MTNLVLKNGESSLTENDFIKIEKKLSFPLPSDLKSLYIMSNGGDPSLNVWIDPFGKWEDIEIRDFFPFIYRETQGNDEHFTAEGIALINWKRNTLPYGFLPFAVDWGGNYICINLNDGNIFYFTRDTWDEGLPMEVIFKKSSRKISTSFSDFIKNVTEFSE